jgi:hypothetical protein
LRFEPSRDGQVLVSQWRDKNMLLYDVLPRHSNGPGMEN